jgi:hypothetical protein
MKTIGVVVFKEPYFSDVIQGQKAQVIIASYCLHYQTMNPSNWIKDT